MNEDDRINRARQGDQTAWIELVRQHQDAVFRMAYLLLGDVDEAQDVAQEAFIRGFRALESVQDDRPLRPWLLQIAKNLARNRRRSARRYLAALRRWWAETNPTIAAAPATGTVPAAATVEAVVGAAIDAELLWRAIGQLSINDQEVLYLRYFLEMSVAESAATLQVAEGTVKSRLSRALARLRNVIEADFPELREEVAT